MNIPEVLEIFREFRNSKYDIEPIIVIEFNDPKIEECYLEMHEFLENEWIFNMYPDTILIPTKYKDNETGENIDSLYYCKTKDVKSIGIFAIPEGVEIND